MRTKHFFKNVRMLTIALALCAAFAATMSGCKKDTTPESPEVTLTQSMTMIGPYMGKFVCNTSKDVRSASYGRYILLDTVAEPRQAFKATSADAASFTVDSLNLFPGRVNYWRSCVTYYVGERKDSILGPVETVNVTAWPKMNYEFVTTTYGVQLRGCFPEGIDRGRISGFTLRKVNGDILYVAHNVKIDDDDSFVCEVGDTWVRTLLMTLTYCGADMTVEYSYKGVLESKDDIAPDIVDATLRKYVVDNYGSDGKLSSAQAEAVKFLDLSNLGIKNFIGINYFKFLDSASVCGNPMKDMILSYQSPRVLLKIYCSNCPNLEYAYLNANDVFCNDNPKLKRIDVQSGMDCTRNPLLDTVYTHYEGCVENIIRDDHTKVVVDDRYFEHL